MAKFKSYRKDQFYLLPPSLEDYIPEGHMARLVYEIVEGLDTTAIEDKYSELGQNTYHPKILIKLLFYRIRYWGEKRQKDSRPMRK